MRSGGRAAVLPQCDGFGMAVPPELAWRSRPTSQRQATCPVCKRTIRVRGQLNAPLIGAHRPAETGIALVDFQMFTEPYDLFRDRNEQGENTLTDPTPDIGKKYISDVSLSIGMLSALGGLYTIPKPNAGKEEAVKLVCPDCDEPHEFPQQAYLCQENKAHGPFKVGELARGRKIDDKIVKVDVDAVTEARKSVLPEKELELQVHSREEVESYTFPQGNAYVFIPSGKSPLAGILVDLLQKRRDLCLIAKTNLRQTDHLVMVDVELNGQIVIREMIWPEDMKAFPAVTQERSSAKLIAQAEMLLDASVEPFDVDEYKKDSRARVAAVVEEAATGQAPSKTKVKAAKKDAEQDLSQLLEAAIAAKTRKTA